MKIETLIERYPALESCQNEIQAALAKLLDMYRGGGKLLLCGNGGSCSDCEHIVGELMKGFLSLRPIPQADADALRAVDPEVGDFLAQKLQRGLPAISLAAHSGVSTAFGNDVDGSATFAQMVYGYGRPGDAVLGISTSGNSKNVVTAAVAAKAMGLITIGLTGAKPCRLDDLCDVVIKVPATETYKIQEYHLPVYHYLCAALESELFGG